jgi:hypothetical protein
MIKKNFKGGCFSFGFSFRKNRISNRSVCTGLGIAGIGFIESLTGVERYIINRAEVVQKRAGILTKCSHVRDNEG